MLKRALLALLALANVVPATALDLQSTTVPGRAVPSLGNGEIAINRADRTLFFKNTDGSIGRGSLMNAIAAGRRAVEEGRADDLTIAPSATAPGGTLARRLASPTFDGPATLNSSLTINGPGALSVGAPGPGEMSVNAPTANHYLSGNAFFTRGRLFVHNPADGVPLSDWLGGGTCNAAGGGPNHYAYGACATVTAQNGLGDVAITGVTRTSDIKRAEDVNVLCGWLPHCK